ncbi:MAG: hypothetical protein HY720_05020 [Planctomycetes bacterium]|nr:hypothetical protein [Planctomycetota bacterium]
MRIPCRLALALALALGGSPAARSQEPVPGGDTPAIEQKIKDIEGSVRVIVRLRNGSHVTGLVKNGQFIESAGERGFLQADKLEGNGIRVWYAENSNDGFIYLEWKEILDIEIERLVTEEELVEMAEDADRKAKEAIDRARKLEEETRKYFEALKEKETHKKREEDLASAAGKVEDRVEEYYRAVDILKKFPPEEGWGEEKYRQIYLNWVRDDDGAAGRGKGRIVPSGLNKEFYDNYKFWAQALQWQKQGLLDKLPPRAEEATPAEGTAEPSTAGGSTGETASPETGTEGSSEERQPPVPPEKLDVPKPEE